MSSIEIKQKKKMDGVVYTPRDVAEEMVRHVLSINVVADPKILEPSVGDGVFLSCLKCAGISDDKISAVDINHDVLKRVKAEHVDAKFYCENFVEFSLKENTSLYDVVIGNPPYIRKHNFSKDLSWSVKNLAEASGCKLRYLKNAWAAFIVAAERVTSSEGILAFIIPYEILNVKYGIDIQEFLNIKFGRTTIYVPDKKAFPEILQDAVVLVSERKVCEDSAGLYVSHVDSLVKLVARTRNKVRYDDVGQLPAQLKQGLLCDDANQLIAKLRKNLPTISKYCRNAAGTVTGANEFFILSSEEVESLNAEEWVKPVLRKSSFLPRGPIFGEADFRKIALAQKCYLLDLGDANESELPGALQQYLQRGISDRLSERYKCSRRDPWYNVPVVPLSEGFFFKRAHNFPRFCVNEAGVYVTDTAYHVWASEGYNIHDICFSFYNTLTVLFAEIEGRFYGGGVLEMTPNEFRSLPFVFKKPSAKEFRDFMDHFPSVSDMTEMQFNSGNQWLKRELQLEESDISLLVDATRQLRKHRLNHAN